MIYFITQAVIEVGYTPTELILFGIVSWLVVQQLLIWKDVSFIKGWIKGQCNGNIIDPPKVKDREDP
jgi:hypothetical protein